MERHVVFPEHPATLAQFDAYVVRARAERAKAIAEFCGTLAARLWVAAARCVGRLRSVQGDGRTGPQRVR